MDDALSEVERQNIIRDLIEHKDLIASAFDGPLNHNHHGQRTEAGKKKWFAGFDTLKRHRVITPHGIMTPEFRRVLREEVGERDIAAMSDSEFFQVIDQVVGRRYKEWYFHEQ